MKYPKKQFDILVKYLRILGEHFDLDKTNVHVLHRIIYQHFSEGQSHNDIMVNDNGDIVSRNRLDDVTGWRKLIDPMFGEVFNMYPVGCNDTHIETAMKKAMALLKSDTADQNRF